MTTFALVHGAYHGGWCWDLLGAELDALGFAWVAPDLPCDEPDAGVADYADAVVEALQKAGVERGSDLVVVGHSLGGLTAPMVASLWPTRQVVFLAAVVPEPGKPAAQATYPPVMSEQWPMLSSREIAEGPLSRFLPADAIEIFFHDCAPDVATWAASKLRSQSYVFMADPSPLTALPDVEYRYFACTEDRTLAFSWQVEAARRLGVEAVVFQGGHSPFLAQAKEVARQLVADLGDPGDGSDR